jgi:DNA-directed RNA polymerase specialized sigma24 family protein
MHSDELRAEHLEALLRRLAPHRDEAGIKYVQLRQRLMAVLANRGCLNPGELADETLDRVGRKLAQESGGHEGDDPAPFVFRVAFNIARESFRRPRLEVLSSESESHDAPAVGESAEDAERAQRCLDRCLGRLSSEDRILVLTYYEGERRAKITQRALLAREHRISANALRLRIWRLTSSLRECSTACMEMMGRAGLSSGLGRVLR